MPKGQKKLSDQVRDAVDTSRMSRYRICKLVGIAEATMSRFMSGQGGLSMKSLDALSEFLSLRVIRDKKDAARSKNRGKGKRA